jgi:hypothetical protein
MEGKGMKEETKERYFLVLAIGLYRGSIAVINDGICTQLDGCYLNRKSYKSDLLRQYRLAGTNVDSFTIVNITEVTQKESREYLA